MTGFTDYQSKRIIDASTGKVSSLTIATPVYLALIYCRWN